MSGESFESSGRVEVQKEVEMTNEQISKILFWSFYYSQGDIGLQKYILEYCATIHPYLTTPEGSPTQELEDLCVDRIHKFLSAGKAHRKSNREVTVREVHEELERFFYQFRKERTCISKERAEKLGHGIVIGIIRRDHKFLYQKERGGSVEVKDGYLRKDISHFIDYVLEAKNAKGEAVEFKKMKMELRKLVDFLPKIPENELQTLLMTRAEFKEKIKSIIAKEEDKSKRPVDLSQFPALKAWIEDGEKEEKLAGME